MSEETYNQRNRDVILNRRAKDYYKNDKERLRDNASYKYKHLSEEQKNKKRAYERNIYHHISKDKKEKVKEYQRNYSEANKSKKACFFMDLIMYAMFLNHKLLNPQHLCHLYTLMEIKT